MIYLTYGVVVSDFLPLVTGRSLWPFGVLAAVDDHVFRLDSTLNHALKKIIQMTSSMQLILVTYINKISSDLSVHFEAYAETKKITFVKFHTGLFCDKKSSKIPFIF